MQSENIQIFPITVSSTFVTLSWNTSGSLSTGRGGYILQVRLEDGSFLKRYEDIDVGLKMNSYTVNALYPGRSYTFELCLLKGLDGAYIIPISSTILTTKESEFELALGIETDYVSLAVVGLFLSGLTVSCIGISVFRLLRLRAYTKDGDSLSQREMMASPSDHSSVAVTTTVSKPNLASIASSVTTAGDKSRLMEHEVTSPVDDVVDVRETMA